jgi:glycosidase
MKPLKTLLIILLTIFQSCNKSEDTIIPSPTPIDGFQPVATEDIVMYEINPKSFCSTKNLQGITNRLDDIKALGVNTIWIMPIYPVGVLNSFGSFYCVKDYKLISPNYGTMDDLKTLVSTAHSKGIAVLFDWVANHTSWDNAWITANPSWYTHDTNGNIIHPAGTNWNDVADLNFDNSAMRLAMIDAMKFWVTEANIDGYRCDAADFVPYNFWQQANTALNAIPNKKLILLAEGARTDHFTAGFQLNFSWDYMNTIKNVFGTSQQNASNIISTSNNEYAVVPTGKKKLRFTTNHDESFQSTPISVYGSKNGALAASVITIYLQGVPLLYCGQEVGVSNITTYNGTNTIDWTANADMLLAYKNVLSFYNSSSAVKKGSSTSYSTSNVVAFQKTYNAENVLVIVNARSSAQVYTVPEAIQGNWTNALTNETVTLSTSLSLSGFQYLILKK